MTLVSSVSALSDEEPCGQDLDLEEDPAYLQFMASIDALLPDTYMQEEDGKRVPFYTSQRYQGVDLRGLLSTGAKLTGRAHDLRLLAVVAKLQILNRSLPLFAAIVADMAALLSTFPRDVHPRGHEERAGALERLNESLVLSALNQAVLLKSRRFGGLTWASYLAAARADGSISGTDAVERILSQEVKGDPGPLQETKATIQTLSDALGTIITASADISPASVPDLQKLIDLVMSIRAMTQRVDPEQDGAEASAGQDGAAQPGPDTPAAAVPKGTLPLLPDAHAAEAALATAERFFASVEPSSPCLLLLRQAQALAGKSFFEALQALVPDSAEKAVFAFTPTLAFDLPLKRAAEAEGTGSSSRSDERATRAASGRLASAVTSRAEALSLLDQVSAFYRFVEPSSPIPVLVERARALAGKDFASLLKAMLPEKTDASGW